MTAHRTRIAYLAHAFMVGGAEEMVLNLVRHLPDRFEPMVCCINQPGPIGEEIRQTGAPLTALGLNPGLRRPRDIQGIRHYLREIKPAIVHTFLITASLYGRFAAILEHVPIVIGTEVNIYRHKRPLHALAERLLMAGTTRVVASAESVREFYIKQIHASPAKVEVVYNAVDWNQLKATVTRDEVRQGLGIHPSAKVAGVIARLTEQKGHHYLFEALANTRALENVEVIVVGDGDLRDRLAQDVRGRALDRRVHFVGARRDLGNLLAAMDVFVLPSLWEGLPLSLILAMGAGLPVVATAVAGVPEVVEDGRTGLLVAPGDAVAIGGALQRVLADDTLAARLGRDAQAAVLPRFGVEGYVRSIVELYDRVLDEEGVCGPREAQLSRRTRARGDGVPLEP